MKIEEGDIFFHPEYNHYLFRIVSIHSDDQYLVSIDHYIDNMDIVYYRILSGIFISTLYKIDNMDIMDYMSFLEYIKGGK